MEWMEYKFLLRDSLYVFLSECLHTHGIPVGTANITHNTVSLRNIFGIMK